VRFLLGTHETTWLARTRTPLFVSHRRLALRRSLPVAVGSWALDSGGFSELSLFGEWRTTVPEYVEAVASYEEEIGGLEWAAPMDWMCEPWLVEKTGLSVREHQERTVENYLELRGRGPFIPVLQGWEVGDYLNHVDMYQDAGVDLTLERLVGLGSVCRRQDTVMAGRIVRELQPIRLHGFGVKLSGLRKYREHLVSADSMAWSYRARRSPPLPGHSHRSCANCLEYALRWRDQVLGEPQTLWEQAA
jgi:hypothetical protein